MPSKASAARARTAALAASIGIAALLGLPGCRAVGRAPSFGGSSALTGQDGRVALSPNFRVFAYAPGPNSTADVYRTDFTRDELDAFCEQSGAWSALQGHILHIHMFLQPKAGATPIDPTAANAAVRLLVMADGQLGVYTGAGFLLPDRAPGGRSFGGNVLNASLRLDHATDYFQDRLGAATLKTSFTAPRDPQLAADMAARLNAAQRTAGPIAPVEPNRPSPIAGADTPG